jgi:hypothetical protein
MRIVRLFRLILFIYEFINFLFVAAIMVFSSINQAGLTQIAFGASAAMFPLMALFIWLDSTRYRAYLPLFTAGKCIGIFSILGWSIIAEQVKISSIFSGAANFESFLLYSYLFSMVVILLIIRDLHLRDKNLSDEKKLEVE